MTQAADGSLNITVVNGSTYTGMYASTGAINTIAAPTPVIAPIGIYHKCGAIYTTTVASGLVGHYAADGSMNICVSPYTAANAVHVTII